MTRPDFIGAGWSYPLGVRPNGTIATCAGTEKLEQAMRIVLSTYPGERPMRPEFGCRLRDYVFEAVSWENCGGIASEVSQSLARWEPRVEVKAVDVLPMADEFGLFHIDISYLVRATNEERNLVYPFYSIPQEGEL
jgi:phage baseplate assembly protein W